MNDSTTTTLDPRLATLIAEGFTPTDAVAFLALEREDTLRVQLEKAGLGIFPPTDRAALAWRRDMLLKSKGNRVPRAYVERRTDEEGNVLVLIDLPAADGTLDLYGYALTPHGLRMLEGDEMQALRARTTLADEHDADVLDASVELRLDGAGLPVAFVEDGYDDLPGGRTLDVILDTEGQSLASRSAFMERFNCSRALPTANVQ